LRLTDRTCQISGTAGDCPHMTTSTLAARLAAPITVAEPDVVGPLAVFQLTTDASPRVAYRAFADARSDGVAIKEMPGGGSVNDLIVVNPTELPVLLYEGEEVLGAQQNRTFDVSVLVAGTSVRVPVSCVEQGRWDHRRHGESFAPAPQAAHPELRRLKNARVRSRLAAGEEPRAAQLEVWAEVAAKSARHGVASRTRALHDVFEDRRELLDRVGREASVKCSQVGMLAAIGGRFVVLDYVSDVEALATLHDPLVVGYGFDALDATAGEGPVPSLDDARDFVRLLLDAQPRAARAMGLGETLRYEFGALGGTALAADGELVTLTAFGGRAAA
jgi:ARG/rhodanese/phosphatase superfamily protein